MKALYDIIVVVKDWVVFLCTAEMDDNLEWGEK